MTKQAVAQNIEEEIPNNPDLIEEYKELDKKCSKILKRIKRRKTNGNHDKKQ